MDAAQFKNAKPFPYLVTENFLPPADAEALRMAVLRERLTEKDADLFYFFHTQDLAHSAQDPIRKAWQFWNTELKTKVEKLTSQRLTHVDMAGQVYPDTGYLLPHDDRLEGRRVAYVLNLSKEFTPSDGGALEFFETKEGKPTNVAKSIVPKFNTLILFSVSEKSFHQVAEVTSDKQRVSISGWFHG